MNKLLDAMDALNCARNLVRAIAMTTRCFPNEDAKAIGALCEAIEARFEEGMTLLDAHKDEGKAGT